MSSVADGQDGNGLQLPNFFKFIALSRVFEISLKFRLWLILSSKIT